MQTAQKQKPPKIRISISYERSTNYVEEYWIEDIDGNVIKPWDFPDEWSGKIFQLIGEQDADSK